LAGGPSMSSLHFDDNVSLSASLPTLSPNFINVPVLHLTDWSQ